jgi:hypothetical protein
MHWLSYSLFEIGSGKARKVTVQIDNLRGKTIPANRPSDLVETASFAADRCDEPGPDTAGRSAYRHKPDSLVA